MCPAEGGIYNSIHTAMLLIAVAILMIDVIWLFLNELHAHPMSVVQLTFYSYHLDLLASQRGGAWRRRDARGAAGL
eukprot:2331683-Pleurochrysis_carterae.AAC.1